MLISKHRNTIQVFSKSLNIIWRIILDARNKTDSGYVNTSELMDVTMMLETKIYLIYHIMLYLFKLKLFYFYFHMLQNQTSPCFCINITNSSQEILNV